MSHRAFSVCNLNLKSMHLKDEIGSGKFQMGEKKRP